VHRAAADALRRRQDSTAIGVAAGDARGARMDARIEVDHRARAELDLFVGEVLAAPPRPTLEDDDVAAGEPPPEV
jgi:hypothetical protein